MHKKIDIDYVWIEKLILEIEKNTLKMTESPFSFTKNSKGTSLTINSNLNIDNLRKTFNIINSGIILSQITPEFLKFDDFISFQITNPLLWTYPQLRIDCDANKSFSAPWHKDGWILGENLKGIVVWLPVSADGGSLQLLQNTNDLECKVIKNNYWGLEADFKDQDLNPYLKNIHVKYGQALVFDENVLHRSFPIRKGQLTLQLRYFNLHENNFYRPAVQKITEPVMEFQKLLPS